MAGTHRPIAAQYLLAGVERSERNLGGRECPLIGMTGNSLRTRLAYATAFAALTRREGSETTWTWVSAAG
jgi:hypothetical protein